MEYELKLDPANLVFFNKSDKFGKVGFIRTGIRVAVPKGASFNRLLINLDFIKMAKFIESNALHIRRVVELVPVEKVQKKPSLYDPIVSRLKEIQLTVKCLNKAAQQQKWHRKGHGEMLIHTLAGIQLGVKHMLEFVENSEDIRRLGGTSISLVVETQNVLRFIDHYNKEVTN